MSFGLRKFSGFRWAVLPSLVMGTPSTTKSGRLLAFTDDGPRMRMKDPAPGAPLLEEICTPDTLPEISFSGLTLDDSLKSAASTLSTEPVTSPARCSPYPTTTSSSICRAAGARATSIVVRPAMATVCASNPTKENRSESASLGTRSEYCPSSLVAVPTVTPGTDTFAPGNGALSSALVTVPLICRS